MSVHRVRVGSWRVWVPTSAGSQCAPEWIALVERLAATSAPVRRSKHARTYRARGPAGDAYIKIYGAPSRERPHARIKQAARASKGRNVLRVSHALASAGFCVPRVLAAGEERSGPLVRRSWVAMAPLVGEPAPDRLVTLPLAEKRALLAAVGTEIARLHVAGFIAGDLVPQNVWIAEGEDRTRVAFLDNDRTRSGWASAPWWRARRNLVQLNRTLLPGVTATDRLRVYRAYVTARAWSRAQARRRLPWIIAKTAERRQGTSAAATLRKGNRVR